VTGPFHYTLYGRAVRSDLELRFLRPTQEAPEDAMTLRLQPSGQTVASTPWYESDRGDEGGIRVGRTSPGELVIRFADATVFRVAADGRAIETLTAPSHYTPADLAAYAVGPVLAIALHLQGALLLHAAAVVSEGAAVLFAGPSGSGKSATAARLHREGWGLLSDDVTEVRADPWTALPAIPAVRLWPDAVQTLFGADAVFEDRAPSWDKKIVTVPEENSARAIAAVVLLDRANGPRTPERLRGREAWSQLIAHAYTAALPDKAMAARIFDATARLAADVPLYRFAPPPLADPHPLGAFLARELGLP
jgi:hypothetical protein